MSTVWDPPPTADAIAAWKAALSEGFCPVCGTRFERDRRPGGGLECEQGFFYTELQQMLAATEARQAIHNGLAANQ